MTVSRRHSTIRTYVCRSKALPHKAKEAKSLRSGLLVFAAMRIVRQNSRRVKEGQRGQIVTVVSLCLCYLLWNLQHAIQVVETRSTSVVEWHHQSHADSHSSVRQKPQLVIHVGPPKTATTTIQRTLSMRQWEKVLALDNYTYTGAYYKQGDARPYKEPLPVHLKLINRTCHRAMRAVRENVLQWDQTATLRNALGDLPCVQQMIEAVEPFQRKRQSLIISDETIQVSFDFESIHALLRDDWDVSIVVGYRRYVHWLPSAKQQAERWTPEKTRLNKWASKGGLAIQGIFPDHWKSRASNGLPYMYTDSILAAVPPQLSIQIMNMHMPNSSVRSTFLCEALPLAFHACAASRTRDRIEHNETISNPAQSLAYDRIVMAAEAAGLIRKPNCRPMPRRHQVVVKAQQYHEQVMNQTDLDFPVVCPSDTEYEAFLQESLNYEKIILPHFYNSKPGAEAHTAEFWEAVATKKYCDVDTARVLGEPHWISFFARMMSC
jgi:hypothetical protein